MLKKICAIAMTVLFTVALTFCNTSCTQADKDDVLSKHHMACYSNGRLIIDKLVGKYWVQDGGIYYSIDPGAFATVDGFVVGDCVIKKLGE